MSGSGAGQMRCSCAKSRCLTGICRCVKANLPCSTHCRCYDCQNTKKSPVNYQLSRCRCKKTRCSRQCSCLEQDRRCTAKCKCLNCENSEGLGGGDTDTEQQQGSEDSVNNVPDKAVQTSPPRDNGGSGGSNKRPRNQLSL